MIDNLTLAKKAALAAGEVILSYYTKESAQLCIDQKSEDVRDKVTAADFAANERIVRMLYKEGSEAGILTEEKLETDDIELRKRMDNPFSYRRFWCIDPIDGTLHFINKTDDFGVHIALIQENAVVLGVSYLPAHGIMYWSDGKYSYRDAVKIHCSEVAEFAGARFLESTHYPEPTTPLFVQEGVVLSTPGCIGNKAGLIAEGKNDAFVKTQFGLNLWDVASSIPVITCAGGKVTDRDGKSLNLREAKLANGFVMANAALHEKIIEILEKNKKNV